MLSTETISWQPNLNDIVEASGNKADQSSEEKLDYFATKEDP